MGMWFLETYATIPQDRMDAAIIVFHFSIISTIILILQVPYTSSIIASEKFTIFALFDIGFAVLRLVSAFILLYIGSDKLVLYGGLVLFSTVLMSFGKLLYCRMHINYCRIVGGVNSEILRKKI